MIEPPETPPETAPPPSPEEGPPILGTWPRLYAALLLYLVGLIVLFTWFTGAFA